MIYTKKYLGLILLIVLVFIKISNFDFVKRIENISYDAYQSIFEEESSFENVIIIDIDEKSIGEIGQFPWRRDIFGNLIEKLSEFEAAVIVFDIFFSEKDKQNPQDLLLQLQKESDQFSNIEVINTNKIFIDSIKKSKAILPIIGDPNDNFVINDFLETIILFLFGNSTYFHEHIDKKIIKTNDKKICKKLRLIFSLYILKKEKIG